MKNILLFALLFTGLAQAQIVNIPDAAFKGKLLAANASNKIAYSGGAKVAVDTNGDGEIQVAEAAVIDSLNIPRNLAPVLTISDLTGINAFVNLKKLDCSSHTLGNLPALNLPLLELLKCRVSGLNTLDILGCPAIKELDCYGNLITALDLANAVQLKVINCAFNQIASLNLSNVPALDRKSVV